MQIFWLVSRKGEFGFMCRLSSLHLLFLVSFQIILTSDVTAMSVRIIGVGSLWLAVAADLHVVWMSYELLAREEFSLVSTPRHLVNSRTAGVILFPTSVSSVSLHLIPCLYVSPVMPSPCLLHSRLNSWAELLVLTPQVIAGSSVLGNKGVGILPSTHLAVGASFFSRITSTSSHLYFFEARAYLHPSSLPQAVSSQEVFRCSIWDLRIFVAIQVRKYSSVTTRWATPTSKRLSPVEV